MADTKISALAASTVPLAGTEVLPIVQSGTTKQVSVANLTAGRAVSVASLTASTGNIVIGTSGQGIDFSATPGTGTSELLNDYEEGTFTATLTADTPPSSSLITTGHYTKIGRLVTVMVDFSNYDTTGAAGTYYITGLPFTSANNGTINYGVLATFNFAIETGCAAITANTSQIILAPTYGASLTTSVAGSGKYIRATITYIAA
jgi:hypothetical protein